MARTRAAGIFLVNKKNELLICHPTRHSMELWGIPKGAIDEGESNLEAALRETYEEANIDLRKSELTVYILTEQVYKSRKKVIYPFLILERDNDIDFSTFELKCNTNVEPEKGGFPEVDEYRWASLNEAENLLISSQAASLPEIRNILK